MKSSTAKLLLKNLGDKRRGLFLSQIQHLSKGDLLVSLCKYLHENSKIDEEGVSRHLRIDSRQYFKLLTDLGNQLRLFWVGQSEFAEIGQLYDLACLLVPLSEVEALTDILRAGIKAAGQIENFDMVRRFRRLASQLNPAPAIEGMSAAAAVAAERNLLAYEDLMDRFQAARSMEDLEQRSAVMLQILSDPLLSSPEMALSLRATYYYWKLSSYWLFMRQHLKAIEYQRPLVEFIAAHPWIFPDPEAVYVKELCLLAMLCRETNQSDDFNRFSQEIHAKELKSEAAKYERTLFTFPYKIFHAIDQGILEEVVMAISDFISVQGLRQFPLYFVTENLYGCIYGAIASNQEGLRKKALRLLREYPRTAFREPYFMMFKLQEVVIALDETDYDEARRLIKNLRQAKELPKGMRDVLAFLSLLISIWDMPGNSGQIGFPPEAAATLEALAANSRLFEYFDLPAWVLSKAKGCTMLDIFRHRASGTAQV